LFDVSTATLLSQGMVDLGATPDAAIQRADGSVWLIVGRAITRIDPVTLARTIIGTLSAAASTMAWVGAPVTRAGFHLGKVEVTRMLESLGRIYRRGQ
jgi:hypothetical protein